MKFFKMYMVRILLSSLFVFCFLGCAEKTDKEYFDLAAQEVSSQNIKSAIESYNAIAEKYPQSRYASKALYEIGKIYHGNLLEEISEVESNLKAIGYFWKVYENYPETEEAPLSLFMCAFIQANELKDYETAKQNYQLFVEKYSDHQMISAAKEELNVLGISPNDVLKRKSAGR